MADTYNARLDQARQGDGLWVSHREMHPATNVSGRIYRTKNGDLHILHDLSQAHYGEIDAWFFPKEQVDG